MTPFQSLTNIKQVNFYVISKGYQMIPNYFAGILSRKHGKVIIETLG